MTFAHFDRLSASDYCLRQTAAGITAFNGVVQGSLRISNASVMVWNVNRLDSSVPVQVGVYAVASLPAGAAGDTAYASDGRKAGEGGGSGTGVLVFYDGSRRV
jgi:hypothetical protein